MKERIISSAVKSAAISFGLGFVFVAGMINKAMKDTAESIIKFEEEVKCDE